MIKIIGIDPGLAGTGVAVVRGKGIHVEEYAFGSVQTAKEKPLPERLHEIYSRLTDVLQDEKPRAMVVEDVFSLKQYPKSGINLGKVVGVILLAGWEAGVPVVEIAVREAKKILSGNGTASKMQLELAVRNVLGHAEPIRPYHASDALALALIGLYRYETLSLRSSAFRTDF